MREITHTGASGDGSVERREAEYQTCASPSPWRRTVPNPCQPNQTQHIFSPVLRRLAFRTLLGCLACHPPSCARINIRCGAPRTGDLLPGRVTGTKTSRQSRRPPPRKKKNRGGRHTSGMNVWLIRGGGILSGGVKSFQAAAAAAAGS